MKKIRITEKNIYTVNGLINRFFKSIEKKKHYINDTDLIKWNKPNKYYIYTSRHGKSYVATRNGKLFIFINYPIKSNIRIGDYVSIDGNRFMYRAKDCKYGTIYFRKLPEYEVAR